MFIHSLDELPEPETLEPFFILSWRSYIETVSKSYSLWLNTSQIHLFIPPPLQFSFPLLGCCWRMGVLMVELYSLTQYVEVVGLSTSERGLI